MRAIPVAVGSVVIGMTLAGGVPRAKAPPPGPPMADWRTAHASGGTLEIPRGLFGHFFVTGDVAGQPVRFIVDTGASGVLLNRVDARAIGLDVDHLAFDRMVETASGTAQVASVTLPRLRVGDIQLLDVPAAVIDRDEGLALLGQTFLSRIDDVSIHGDTMRLFKG